MEIISSREIAVRFRYSSGKENILSTGLLGAGSKIVTNYYQYMGSNTGPFAAYRERSAVWLYPFLQLDWLAVRLHQRCGYATVFRGLKAVPPQHGVFQMFPLTRDRRGQQRTSGAVLGIAAGMARMLSPILPGRLSITSHGLRQAFVPARFRVQPADLQPARQSVFARPIWRQALATALQSGTPGNVTLSQGDALADFLLGNLQSSTVAVAVADANYVRNVEAYYVDDTYKFFLISPFPRVSGTN